MDSSRCNSLSYCIIALLTVSVIWNFGGWSMEVLLAQLKDNVIGGTEIGQYINTNVDEHTRTLFKPIEVQDGEYISLQATINRQPPSRKRREKCLSDLDIMEKTGNLPESLYSPRVNIPFFIFPELLPDPPLTWEECYVVPKEPEKNIYGLSIIQELETSLWRVYDPDKAAVFLIPNIPQGGSEVKGCKRPDSTRGSLLDFSMLQEIAEKYPQVTGHNLLHIVGDYRRVKRMKEIYKEIREKREKYDQEIREKNDQEIREKYDQQFSSWREKKYIEKYDQEKPFEYNKEESLFLYMRKSIFASYHTCLYEEDFSAFPQVITLDQGLSHYEIKVFVDEEERTKCIEEHEAALKKMSTYDGWVKHKSLNIGGFYRYDIRYRFDIRKRLFHIYDVCENDLKHKLEPFALIGHEIDNQENASECALPDPLGTLCCSNIKGRFNDVPFLTKALDASIFQLSIQGDNDIAQNTYEGLVHRSLTIHGLPMTHFEVSLPLHSHVPWVLLGIWDDNLCMSHRYNDPLYCILRLMNEYNDLPEKHKVHMYKALLNSGKEVTFDMSDSRAAHNLIFQVAWGLPDKDLSRLGISRSLMMPKYPPSCLQLTQRMPPGWIDYKKPFINCENCEYDREYHNDDA